MLTYTDVAGIYKEQLTLQYNNQYPSGQENTIAKRIQAAYSEDFPNNTPMDWGAPVGQDYATFFTDLTTNMDNGEKSMGAYYIDAQ